MTRPGPTGAQRIFLFTGVTGFLGKVLLEELVHRSQELGIGRVFVVIRPLRGRGAAERFAREVVASPCLAGLPAGWERMVTVIEADLELPTLPATITGNPALHAVTHVVHAAASVRFDLPLALAARANVHATLNMLGIAQSLPGVERFVYVSTAYVTPQRDAQPIAESLVPLPAAARELFATCLSGTADDAAMLRRTGHPNTYTFTKAIAEHLVAERRGAIPVTIMRPSIVTASLTRPFPGWIDSTSGFAGFVMLAGLGHLRALVCDPRAKLDLIPVDTVARRIVRASLEDTGQLVVRHVVAGAANAPTVTECWETTQRYFTAHQVDRRPGGRYLGPRSLRFQLADFVQHRLPLFVAGLTSRAARRQMAKLRTRLTAQNREFAYFTTRTFQFETSAPVDAAYDRVQFIETIDRGVHRHLLTRQGPQ